MSVRCDGAMLAAAARRRIPRLPFWHGEGRSGTYVRVLARRFGLAPRLLKYFVMMRSYRPRDPAIAPLGFTCYRLVPCEDGLWPVELMMSRNRMFAFVGR